MANHLQETFKASADNKIISDAEFKEKVKKLHKEGLSLGEKAVLYSVDYLTSAAAGLVFLAKLPTKKFQTELMQRNSAWNIGIWNAKNTSYTSEATLEMFAEFDLKFAFSKSITAKSWALAAQAVKDCKDYRGTPELKQAKPALGGIDFDQLG